MAIDKRVSMRFQKNLLGSRGFSNLGEAIDKCSKKISGVWEVLQQVHK